MGLEYDELTYQRATHPAWRLLTADHAPLIAAFLHTTFRETNARTVAESELTLRLDDMLYELRRREGDEAFPRSADDYLTEWAQSDKGWLRKFYPTETDEAHYDLTPATEQTLAWLESLGEREFVGTESRLATAVGLLEQIAYGAEEDADARIARLVEQKRVIDAEIASIRAGDIPVLDDRELRERFLQFRSIARGLMSDFRSVEHNFRELDRRVRREIAEQEGDKAALLSWVFGGHDAIAESDEGRSFRAFWDFLMSPRGQEHLSELLDRVLALEPLREANDDRRMRRIHYEWMAAGEQTQRTVARLSNQLRRFLDNQAYLENRRIVEILDRISRHAMTVREHPPRGDWMEIDAVAAEVNLPMERPLYRTGTDDAIDVDVSDDQPPEVDLSALYNQVFVDTERLNAHIRATLREEDQAPLSEVVRRFPLKEGLAELVGYLSVASGSSLGTIDEGRSETIRWTDRGGIRRRARVPVVLFQRRSGA